MYIPDINISCSKHRDPIKIGLVVHSFGWDKKVKGEKGCEKRERYEKLNKFNSFFSIK